jgi:hypothetical protein
MLKHLQRLHGERERIAAVGLEAIEVGLPRFDTTGREVRLAQVLVRRNVIRVASEDALIGSDGGFRRALLLIERSKVELGGDRVRVQHQRTPIGGHRFVAPAQHLKRNAVVVVGLRVVGIDGERGFERSGGASTLPSREQRDSERSMQRQRRRRSRNTVAKKRDGAGQIAVVLEQLGRRRSRFDESRGRVDRVTEALSRRGGIARVRCAMPIR